MDEATVATRDGEVLLARVARLEAELDELRALRDVEQIKRMHRSYVRELADRSFDALLDYFDDEAVIDMRTHGEKRGKAEIAEHFAPLREVIAEGSGYLLTSPVIHVDGDRARGEWTWHRLLSQVPTPTGPLRIWGPWFEGRYRCEYVRRDGEWKFARMHFRMVLPDADPS